MTTGGCSHIQVINRTLFFFSNEHSLIGQGGVVTSQSPPRPNIECLVVIKKIQALLWLVAVPIKHPLWSMCRGEATWHRTQKIWASIVVAIITTLIVNFPSCPSRLRYAYISCLSHMFPMIKLQGAERNTGTWPGWGCHSSHFMHMGLLQDVWLMDRFLWDMHT